MHAKDVSYGRKIMAVVKADCYGQGVFITPYIENIVDCFAVSCAMEGSELRQLGITKQILVLGYNKSQHDTAVKYNLTASLSSIDDFSNDLSYHIAVDTGMNRLGIKSVEELKSLLENEKTCNIEGLYSHIFDSNDKNIANQVAKFEQFKSMFNQYYSDKLTHISSTSSMQSDFVRCTDITRLGIGLYAGAVSVVSNILLVKQVKIGESVGYNGEFIAIKDTTIAVVSGGYADGIVRKMTGCDVMISGKICPIIGKISMDSFQCDITGVVAKAGDNVIIIDNDCMNIDRLAVSTDLTEYEIYTGLKGRYKYVYYI